MDEGAFIRSPQCMPGGGDVVFAVPILYGAVP